jgi:hypothetical protein
MWRASAGRTCGVTYLSRASMMQAEAPTEEEVIGFG